MHLLAPQDVAPAVVLERIAEVVLILERLAESEMQVQAVLGLKVCPGEL